MLKLFISGVFRSGTTLLVRALSAHSQVITVSQPFTPFFKFWRNLYYKEFTKYSFNKHYPMGIDYFQSVDELKHFNNNALSVYFDSKSIHYLKEDIIKSLKYDSHEKPIELIPYLEELKPGTANEIISMLMRIIESGNNSKNISLVGFKETWCEEFITPLLQIPDFKIIHIIRDPRGIIASRNSGRYLLSCGNMKYPLLFIARSWRRSHYYKIKNENEKDYYFLRYEDIVNNINGILKSITAFLDINFEKKMTKPEHYINGEGKQWLPNSSFDTSVKINTSSINKWRNILSDREIGAIEFLCQDEMKKLNYLPKEKKISPQKLIDYEENASEIIEWLRRPPYLMDEGQIKKEINRFKNKEKV